MHECSSAFSRLCVHHGGDFGARSPPLLTVKKKRLNSSCISTLFCIFFLFWNWNSLLPSFRPSSPFYADFAFVWAPADWLKNRWAVVWYMCHFVSNKTWFQCICFGFMNKNRKGNVGRSVHYYWAEWGERSPWWMSSEQVMIKERLNMSPQLTALLWSLPSISLPFLLAGRWHELASDSISETHNSCRVTLKHTDLLGIVSMHSSRLADEYSDQLWTCLRSRSSIMLSWFHNIELRVNPAWENFIVAVKSCCKFKDHTVIKGKKHL